MQIGEGKNVVVVDLDGTLFDTSHRDHLARARDWDAFHSRLHLDHPRDDVAWLLKMLAGDGGDGRPEPPFFLALTGRPERYRAATTDQLIRWGFHMDLLLMRPNLDFRPAASLKSEILHTYFGSHAIGLTRVRVILEDDENTIEALRNIGYACWQVQAGRY